MKREDVPSWALERRTFIVAIVAGGAVIALAVSALAITFPDRVEGWLAAISWSLPVVLVALLLAGGLRRVVLGPARMQTVPINWWTLAYSLTRLLLFGAVILLAIAAGVAWTFGSSPRGHLIEALVLLIVVTVTINCAVKTIGNAYLLIRYWRAE